MADGQERRRRPDPERDGPNRGFTGAFGADPWSRRDELWRDRFGPEPRNGTNYRDDWPNGTGDRRDWREGNNAATEGVRVGYDILQEQMRDGQRAAEYYNEEHREDEMRNRQHEHHYHGYPRYSYGPHWRARGFWGEGWSELMAAMQTLVCATFLPGLNPHFRGHGWYPPPDYYPPPYCPPDEHYSGPQSPWYPSKEHVRVQVVSKNYRSARAHLSLKYYRPSMVLQPLHLEGDEAKSLHGYAETIDGRTTLYVEIEDASAGKYVGRIVNGDKPDEELGTLTVHVYVPQDGSMGKK